MRKKQGRERCVSSRMLVLWFSGEPDKALAPLLTLSKFVLRTLTNAGCQASWTSLCASTLHAQPVCTGKLRMLTYANVC
jgi:hypothetical protein